MSPHKPASRRRRPVGTARESLAFVILVVLLLACTVVGGSNRGDIPHLLYLRPLAALAIGIMIASGIDPRKNPSWYMLWCLIVASVAMTALQLVPLPPAIWTRLPGRDMFLAGATLAGIDQPWRPISIVPDMTWNSLASLLVPGAVMLACSTEQGGFMQRTTPWIIALGCGSAMLGLAQLLGGKDSAFYIYPGTADGLPIGILANRNHQALLLAMMLPLLAAWSWSTDAPERPVGYRYAVSGGVVLILLPVILATGSRSGIILTGLAGMAGLVMLPWRHIDKLWRRIVIATIIVVLVAIVSATVLSGRALVFDRLLAGEDLSTEMRIASAPTTLHLLQANLPLGTGLGTFDPAFRMMEPDTLLTPTYRNHAHNDLLELIMTAGLPGLVILLTFLFWIGRAGWRIWRMPKDGQRVRGLAGFMCIAMIMLSSLTDYPLRVPLIQSLLILFSVWVAVIARSSRSEIGRDDRSRLQTPSVAFAPATL